MFDFSTLITDRTAADVAAMTGKGCYNYSDLNRVGAAAAEIAGRLNALGYACQVTARTTWSESDTPTASQMEAYRADIVTLRGMIAMLAETPETPETMGRLTYKGANAIEQILADLDFLITNMAQAWFYSGEIYAGET